MLGSEIDVILIPRVEKFKGPYTQLAQHQVYLYLNTSNWSLTLNSSANWTFVLVCFI